MAKLGIAHLATMLAEKYSITESEAQDFVTALWSVVAEGIEADKAVKVRGLGTFKVATVSARESVNVNTGERVTIDPHAKITFTPDATMKEIVNKPFSGFDTVPLADNVTFDDEPQEAENEPVTESASMEPEQEESTMSPSEEAEEEPVAPQSEEVEEEPVTPQSEEVQEESPAPQNEEAQEVSQPSQPLGQEDNEVETQSDSQDEDDEIEDAPKRRLWIYGLVTACLCALFYAGGWWVGARMAQQDKATPEVAVAKKPVKKAVAKVAKQAPVATKKDTVAVAPKDVTPKDAAPKDTTPDYSQYGQNDARVRTGAYRIVGVQLTVKAQKGETVAVISRRYLGEGMECYVEALNGVKAGTVLTAGQEIKIPQLKLKKRK